MPERYPPGPADNLVQAILSTRRQMQDRLHFLIDMARIYGDICHFRTGLRHVYLLNHPDDIHTVLVDQADKFYKTRPFKRALGRVLGQGLLVIDGEVHKNERRLVQPAFHHKRIEAYAAVMIDYTQRAIQSWHSGDNYAVNEEMMKLTARIVAKTLFDADISEETRMIGESMAILQNGAMRQFRALLHPPFWLPTRQNRNEQRAITALDTIIFRMIDERRASGEDKGDLLSMLLKAADEGGETIQQVRDETISLFVAGHETTANTLAWAWYLLSQHPDVVDKLSEELDRVLGGNTPGVQDLTRLPYTAMIVKETLRLFPPAWIIPREAIADVTIGPYTLKAGSVVVLSPYITHRHPRYFAEPERFLPERFAKGYEENLPRFAYFPFSGGPRVCIGQAFATMEATLILAAIAQQYHLTLVSGQQIELDPLITLRARHGILMNFTRRERIVTGLA